MIPRGQGEDPRTQEFHFLCQIIRRAQLPQHAKLKTQRPSLAGLPELTLASNPLWHLEFGVKVVVGPSHLTNTDPVLPFKRQLEWTPAQAGGQVHDEAHDISKSNDTHIPAEEKRCQAPTLHGCPFHLG